MLESPPNPPELPVSSSESSSSFHFLKSTFNQWYFFFSLVKYGQYLTSFGVFCKTISIHLPPTVVLLFFKYIYKKKSILTFKNKKNLFRYKINFLILSLTYIRFNFSK